MVLLVGGSMKKTKKKLALTTERIRVLTPAEAERAGGAAKRLSVHEDICGTWTALCSWLVECGPDTGTPTQ
jgi:hypothetical protein